MQNVFTIGQATTITMTRGDSFTAEIEILNPDGTTYEPQTGDVVTFTARGLGEVLEKDIPLADLTLRLDPADTELMLLGSYLYTIAITTAAGERSTIIRGRFRLQRGA